MNKDQLPKGFEFFDPERPKVPFTNREGERRIGWHIINLYSLDSYSAQYMIGLQKKRLARLRGSKLAIGSPLFHEDQPEHPEMYGLYHVEEEDAATSLDLAQIQAEAHHQGLEDPSRKTHELQS